MKLDEAIVTNFDAAERAALAAGLGVSWDALPGDTPAARAAALVEALGRDGRAVELPAALALARPAVPWDELPYPAATLRRLHAALCRRHTLDSLRTLCFRLGLDFDDLPGETKSARARELVLAMDRLGRAGELWAASGKRQGTGSRRAGRSSPWPPAAARWTGDGSRLAVRRLWSIVRGRWRVRRHSYLLPLFIALAVALLSAADGRRGEIGTNRQSPTASPLISRSSGLPVSQSPIPSPSPSPSPAAAGEQGSAGEGEQGTTGAGDNRQSPTANPPLSPSPGPSVSQSPSPATVLVGERGANLRRGPGPEYPVVATLRAGARLELRAVSPTGEWYQVRLPGRGSPWIDAGYAVIVGGVGGVPVATAGPAPTTVHRPPAAEPTPTRRPPAAPTATAPPTPPPPPKPTPIPTATAPPP